MVLLCVSLAQATLWNMAQDSKENSNLASIEYQNEFDEPLFKLCDIHGLQGMQNRYHYPICVKYCPMSAYLLC